MFWDKLKAATPEPRPTSVDLGPSGELVIAWDDGKQTKLPPAPLRLACPCAACVDEWTGERIVDEARIPADVRPVGLEPVGNYALQIRWSDGHDTGLYTWRQLRGAI